MSSKSALKNVVRSTASLDFFSNATKSTSTENFLTNVDLSKFTLPGRKALAEVVRATMKAFHPFLNNSEAYKLSIIARHMFPSRPVTYEADLTNGKQRLKNYYQFAHHQDALSFLQGQRSDFTELEQVVLPDASLHLETIDDSIKAKFDEKLNAKTTVETLNELLFTRMFNSQTIQVPLVQKVTYLVTSYLTPTSQNKGTIFTCLEQFITNVDNPKVALNIFQLITAHCISQSSNYKKRLEQLFMVMSTKYPQLAEDETLLLTQLEKYIHYGEREKAHKTMILLSQLGVAPKSSLLTQYIQICINNVSGTPGDNIQLLTFLRGLDNIIYTSIDVHSAELLLQISRSVNEVSSVLDLLESKYSEEEMKTIATQIQSQICMGLRTWKDNRVYQGNRVMAQKVGVLKRVAKWAPWTPETKLFIIKESIQHGSFILARELIGSLELTEESTQELYKLAKGVKKSLISEGDGFAVSRNKRTLDAFLEALAPKS